MNVGTPFFLIFVIKLAAIHDALIQVTKIVSKNKQWQR
jgi:hypothetical protein